MKVEEFTYHNAKLVWSAPKSDGGSPITKYLVEMKTSTESDWTEVSCHQSLENILATKIKQMTSQDQIS